MSSELNRVTIFLSMDPLSLFGLFSVILMLVFYALERRNRWYIFAFALSCLLASAYAFLQGAWPFGIVEIFWFIVVFRRFQTTK